MHNSHVMCLLNPRGPGRIANWAATKCFTSMKGQHGQNNQYATCPFAWEEKCPEMPKCNMPNFMKGKDAQNSQNATRPFEWKERMPRTAKTQHACLNEKKDAQNSECPTCPLQMKGKCPEPSKRNMPIGLKGKMPTTANVWRVHCKGGKCPEHPKGNMPC